MEPAGKQLVNPTNSPSPANWLVIGSGCGVGIFLLVLVLVILYFRYFKAKGKQACKDDTDIEMQQVPGNDEADEGETEEPNPKDALLDNAEMQRVQGNDEADDGEIDEPNQEDDLLDDTQVPLGVEETLDSPLPTGTQDTEPPGRHNCTGKIVFGASKIFFWWLL